MGERPSKIHSVERKNNSFGYSKSNCCWGTPTQQTRNTRTNRILELHGQSMTEVEWAEKMDINYGTLNSRLNKLGWSIEKSLTEPVKNEKVRT